MEKGQGVGMKPFHSAQVRPELYRLCLCLSRCAGVALSTAVGCGVTLEQVEGRMEGKDVGHYLGRVLKCAILTEPSHIGQCRTGSGSWSLEMAGRIFSVLMFVWWQAFVS